MVTVQTIIARLTKLRTEVGDADLSNPQGRREFDFGKAVGHREGIDLALQAIVEALDDEKRKEREK